MTSSNEAMREKVDFYFSEEQALVPEDVMERAREQKDKMEQKCKQMKRGCLDLVDMLAEGQEKSRKEMMVSASLILEKARTRKRMKLINYILIPLRLKGISILRNMSYHSKSSSLRRCSSSKGTWLPIDTRASDSLLLCSSFNSSASFIIRSLRSFNFPLKLSSAFSFEDSSFWGALSGEEGIVMRK